MQLFAFYDEGNTFIGLIPMKKRRVVSLILMALGGVLLFLTPEQAPWSGLVLLVAGLTLEAAGWWLESRKEGK
jgi:hypothetical protein